MNTAQQIVHRLLEGADVKQELFRMMPKSSAFKLKVWRCDHIFQEQPDIWWFAIMDRVTDEFVTDGFGSLSEEEIRTHGQESLKIIQAMEKKYPVGTEGTRAWFVNHKREYEDMRRGGVWSH